ncbi:MAG: LPXTG cell wall anchor domain-containing protein [Ilumatobacter sp.]
MKKLALAFTAAAAVVLGSAGVADAYPPGGSSVVVEDDTISVGDPVTVTATCTLGESVTFTLQDQSATTTCEADATGGGSAVAGSATGTVNAPTTAGTFTGTITGSISGALGTFTVTVDGVAPTTAAPTTPVGGLPATGSDGTQTMTMVAGGILVAGLGMFGVATARRRQDAAAA